MDLPYYLRSWSVPEDETITILNPPEPKMNFQDGYITWYALGILSLLCAFQVFHQIDFLFFAMASAISFIIFLFFPPHLVLLMYQLLEAFSIITTFFIVKKLGTHWALTGIVELFVIFVCRIWYHQSKIRCLEQDIRDLARKINTYRSNQTLIQSYVEVSEQLWSKRMTHLVFNHLFLVMEIYFMLRLKLWS